MSGPGRPDDFDVLSLEVIVRAEAGDDTAVLRKLDDLFARYANRSESTGRDLLRLQDNAALLLAEHHHLEVAIELARRSLSERTRLLGADHPNSLAIRHNLAFWLGESGDAAGARRACQDLAVDQERVFGSDHPDFLINQANLARWQAGAGELPEAIIWKSS
jgi:hypothetical protein